MRKLILTAFFSVGWVIAAHAEITGNDLKETCEGPDRTPAAAYCMAYISGTLDTARTFNSVGSPLYCEPPGVTGPQLLAMGRRYLEDHPERLHYVAATLIMKMMIDNFPCAKK